MCDDIDSLASYWDAIRPPDRKSADVVPDTPEDLSPVLSWAREVGSPGKSPIITIPGRNQAAVFNQLCTDMESRCVTISPGSNLSRPLLGKIFRELMVSEDLTVEGPLREMADKESHIAYDVYRLLWEGRFMLRENASGFEAFVEQIMGWVEGKALEKVPRVLLGNQDQMGVLCFVTALAAQNKLFKRSIVLLDGINLIEDRNVTKELTSMLAEARRWTLLAGCPIGILLGFTSSRSDLAKLRKLNQTLHAEVDAGLSWVKK